jgi:3-methyladenine DNA glycosylase Tag
MRRNGMGLPERWEALGKVNLPASTSGRARPAKTAAAAVNLLIQLKSLGYRYVGPASGYAFLQNVGVVNDHIHGCFRATDYPAAR